MRPLVGETRFWGLKTCSQGENVPGGCLLRFNVDDGEGAPLHERSRREDDVFIYVASAEKVTAEFVHRAGGTDEALRGG